MVEYSLAKAKVEGSSPFFRLEGYLPGLSFGTKCSWSSAEQAEGAISFSSLCSSLIFCVSWIWFFPHSRIGDRAEAETKGRSAGYCQTGGRKRTEKEGEEGKKTDRKKLTINSRGEIKTDRKGANPFLGEGQRPGGIYIYFFPLRVSGSISVIWMEAHSISFLRRATRKQNFFGRRRHFKSRRPPYRYYGCSGEKGKRKKYSTIINKNTIMQKENLFPEPSIPSSEYLSGFFETDSSLRILFEKDARMTFGHSAASCRFFTTASSEVCCSSIIFRENEKTGKPRASGVGIEVMELVR